MEDISPLKRIYYRYIGIMYWLIHWADTHRILGIRTSSFIRILTLIIPILVWIQGWGLPLIALSVIFLIWVQFSYWRSRRQGYFRFVGSETELLAVEDIRPLQKEEHIPVCATGVFSVKDWEKNVIFKPAEYWQLPLGDHALMVEHEPGRFLYQFIKGSLMQDLQVGWLLFGTQPNPALSITFLSSWGPEFNEDDFSLWGNTKRKEIKKQRTVFLSFDKKEYEEAVWQNLLYDARRVREQA